MNRAKQLYELQEIDLGIEKKREALGLVESRLGRNENLLEARAELEREEGRLSELEAQQREGEWEVDDLKTKIASIEEKLYGGSVKNPRELKGLQEEVEYLKAHKGAKEDKILDIMTQVEAVGDSVRIRKRELGEMEQRWREEQERLAQEQAGCKKALMTLEEKHQLLVSLVDSASLKTYQELRLAKRGRAVARVEQGRCQGCRINLSTAELQRSRLDRDLVFCSNCGRILYLS